MLGLWNEDMVRFMRDASEYGNYNRELAKRLAPYLNRQNDICDAGCGLGYLSLELASCAGTVTAVERNPDALAVLAENCRSRGIRNIIPRCGLVGEVVPEKKYDAMVFCFFGGIHEILETARGQCDGQVIVISRNYTTHRFSVGSHSTGNYGYHNASRVLRELGVPCEEETLELEFGQPFRCLEDVRRFFELYSRDEDKGVITDEFLRKKIVSQDHREFPFYMPYKRNLAIIRFKAKDLPKE